MSIPLTHLNSTGQVSMVDVTEKATTSREAVAIGDVLMQKDTLRALVEGNTPKGSVIETARLAGIMAAKQTSALIPLCHPLPLGKVAIGIIPNPDLPGVSINATVKTTAQTGVEMEALTAVSVAALTIYDMLKAIEKTITITNIRLKKKTGGKSGNYEA